MEANKSSKGLIIGLTIAILAVAGIIVYALSNQKDSAPEASQAKTDMSQNVSDTENEAAPTPSERVSLTFTNSGFEPNELTVKKGTIITVTNKSSTDVQFSSADHPTHRENTEMNLKTLSPGESAAYTATKVGEWGYHDHIDDSKTGTITVTE